MNTDSLVLNPSYIAPSAWWQHVPVAHWLVNVIKPNTVVELGSHYGVSFYAFCEAAEAFSCDTFIYAVDTWDGDVHSGIYSQDVYNRVSIHWANFHRTRSRLVRSTFDEAAAHFQNCSIDILHIDGLHTYEAVKHDFETWLPMLKPDSIILFHDTNVREQDFGVWQFWQELKANTEYSSVEVMNGHGLGVLIKGSCYNVLFEDFVAVLPLLVAKGELVEKLAELTSDSSFKNSGLEVQIEQAKSEAEQAKSEAEQAKSEAEQAKTLLSDITNAELWKATLPIRKTLDALKRFS